MQSGSRRTAQSGGSLFDLVAENRRLFEIFCLDGFAKAFLEQLEAVTQITVVAKGFRDFADVACAFVHGLDQAFERLGENLVTLRATEPTGLFEVGLSKTTARALQLGAAGGLLDFLGSTQA